MGCSSSAHEGYCLVTDYKRRGLPEPDPKLYQNDFEKEAYMTINLLRVDPKSMIPQVKAFKKHKLYQG